ncbi:MAG: hypothetical protein DWQ01_08395 [Planctomycetota bacterium]|nr:MAG: hypothetical protein DWQ01_08395 [Planctomycetota bacterium]
MQRAAQSARPQAIGKPRPFKRASRLAHRQARVPAARATGPSIQARTKVNSKQGIKDQRPKKATPIGAKNSSRRLPSGGLAATRKWAMKRARRRMAKSGQGRPPVLDFPPRAGMAKW